MKYRQLGKTGLQVSAIAFGGAPIGLNNYLEAWDGSQPEAETQAIEAILKALEAGINYIDTARAYGNGQSEHIIGKALRQSVQRPYLATKTAEFSYEGVLSSASASLEALGVDAIDVLQFHGGIWPENNVKQVLDGGLRAMQELREAGKIHFIGFTTEAGTPGAYALLRSGAFDLLQVNYNILFQDACNLMFRDQKAGLMIEAEALGMGIVTMRSLTSGIFQKWMRRQVPGIDQLVDLNALCLNFVLNNPYVDSAIVGMRHTREVGANARLVDQPLETFDLDEFFKRYV